MKSTQRLIAIGGEPASGKTTVMRLVLENYPEAKPFKFGTIRGKICNDVIFLGIYSGNTFDGTDRLSMAVQKDIPMFLQAQQTQGKTIVFEGDRLFNGKMLSSIPDTTILVIQADEKIKQARHIKRQDSQTETFLNSRKTKVANIQAKFQHTVITNNTEQDVKKAADYITSLINANN